jgi:hypothetical protein
MSLIEQIKDPSHLQILVPADNQIHRPQLTNATGTISRHDAYGLGINNALIYLI